MVGRGRKVEFFYRKKVYRAVYRHVYKVLWRTFVKYVKRGVYLYDSTFCDNDS